MWQVDNRTPFAVDRSWVRDLDGAEIWLVAVRCTFRINSDGSTTVAEEQDPVVVAPKYLGDPARSSLRYDSDFVLTKPTTDVILNGSAYAPGGKPAATVDVSLRIGEVRKTLRVTGDRRYEQKIFRFGSGPIQSFTKLPLVYERAYGGSEPTTPNKDRLRFDERNPIGTGYFPVAGQAAPNVQYLGVKRIRRVAGFGPIPPNWKPRVSYAGTYDNTWRRERYPLYPRDLDERFFLCSPEDQRPPHFFSGGEIVELTNLTSSGWLTFALPRVALGFETVFLNRDRVQHGGELYTVILEPDLHRVVLVWRASLPCHQKVHSLVGTIVWQKRIAQLTLGQHVTGAVREQYASLS